MTPYRHEEAVAFIWAIADLLRGPYKPHQYGDVILPFVVLRRLDCALRDTKANVLERAESLPDDLENRDPVLRRAAGLSFYNTSPLTFDKLLDDDEHLAENLRSYMRSFSPNAREILEKFRFDETVGHLLDAELLYPVVSRFSELDLHPDRVSNADMGGIFEELIRRFSEQANEDAGHHFTPREVVRLMVDLLMAPDGERLARPGTIVSMYDPACGTGGMLSLAEDRLRDLNSRAHLEPHGQERSPETYAICKADMLIRGKDADNIAPDNTFTNDHFPNKTFDYVIANPPFGLDWNGFAKAVKDEHRLKGHDGRFGPGLPAVDDGQMLFVLQMASKMKDPTDGGTRVAVVLNGSPLFTGHPGGGESEIRRWLIENDLLDAVIGLPDQLFYNTDIHTYVWVISNRKPPERQGYVQFIDARELREKMPKSLGKKRHYLSDVQISEVVALYGETAEGRRTRWLPNERFGYQHLTISRAKQGVLQGGEDALNRLREHPHWKTLSVRKGTQDPDSVRDAIEAAVSALPREGLALSEAEESLNDLNAWSLLLKKSQEAVIQALFVSDLQGEVLRDRGGKPVPDPNLKCQARLPLDGDVQHHLQQQVHPYSPEAWVDTIKIGYEIKFDREFFLYPSHRALEDIDRDLQKVGAEIIQLVHEIAGDPVPDLIDQARQELANRAATAATLGVEETSRRASGLEWAPEIPSHWEVVNYQYVCRTGSGHTPSRKNPDLWQDCTIPWVTTADVKHLRDGRVETIYDTEQKISELGLAHSAASVHPAETVLLSRTASVGFSGIMGTAMATSQDFFTWTCGPRLRPDYLLYVLRAMKHCGHLDAIKYGSTHQTIYMPDLFGLRGPLPPLEEQDRIVAEIRRALTGGYSMVDRMQEQKELLEERRAVFTAGAISGRIER